MKNARIITILFIWLISLMNVQASWIDDLQNAWEQNTGEMYPEQRNKKIEIYAGYSPLKPNKREQDAAREFNDKFDLGYFSKIFDETENLVLNNITGVCLGRIDVTTQVKAGVNSALKDIFKGYPEYQRRVITEEMVNANINTHYLSQDFIKGTYKIFTVEFSPEGTLLDYKNNSDDFADFFPDANLLHMAVRISQSKAIVKVSKLVADLAKCILVVFVMLAIFKRLGADKGYQYAVAEPFLRGIGAYFAISSTKFIVTFIMQALVIFQSELAEFLTVLSDGSLPYVNSSWKSLADNIGYLPVQILSVMDILAQIFIFIYLGALIFYVSVATALSPLWSLAFVSETMKTSAYHSLINWAKALGVLALMPLAYFVIELINHEFINLENDLLSVVISIASFVYLPILTNAIFKINFMSLRKT
ncbi:MAG: hypothetical protein LW817_04430 [Candidatus Caenarcaniphilales bacterium]|nr:hypothetical protein [Candidatus Caenarcaniphilales bacterium]